MKRIWFHGASAGDMRALAPVIERVEDHPALEVAAISTWTESGKRVAQMLFNQGYVRHPPIPIRPWCDTFLAQVKPDLLVLEYLEWYPGWLKACARRHIPVIFIDGRVSARSLRIKSLLKYTSSAVHRFGARTQEDALNAIKLGVPQVRVLVTGNGKYDGFLDGPPEPSTDLIDSVGYRDLVVGSLHRDEEAGFVEALVKTTMTALVAPRYLGRTQSLERRLTRHGLTVARRSAGAIDARVVLLDTMGELASAYGLAPVALVGGTFGRRGGQNLFEPALHNRTIIHGPCIDNIRVEADCLVGRGAYQVKSWTEAMEVASGLYSRVEVSTAEAITQLRGGAQKNMALILDALNIKSKANQEITGDFTVGIPDGNEADPGLSPG